MPLREAWILRYGWAVYGGRARGVLGTGTSVGLSRRHLSTSVSGDPSDRATTKVDTRDRQSWETDMGARGVLGCTPVSPFRQSRLGDLESVRPGAGYFCIVSKLRIST